jgi:hypothetical protein
MSNIVKNIGNIKQFGKEELINVLTILSIGYFGSCVSILANDNQINLLLPDDITKPPYRSTHNPTGINYFFSYNSEFPHHIVSNIDFLDEYLSFYGGITTYVYSSFRFAIKYMFKSVDQPNNMLVDTFSFYLLPIIITYFVLFPFGIPIISLIISIIPCIYQEGIGANALLYTWSCIYNWFDFERVKQLFNFDNIIINFILWFMNGCFGCFISFMVFIVVLFTSLSSWIYINTLWFLLPLYLKFLLNKSFSEIKDKISKKISEHHFGLITLFLLYTIQSSYKNLNSQVAMGVLIGSIVIILTMLKELVKIKFNFGFLQGLMMLSTELNLGSILFWGLISIIIIYKYLTTKL